VYKRQKIVLLLVPLCTRLMALLQVKQQSIAGPIGLKN
jgi:hypothetical protein